MQTYIHAADLRYPLTANDIKAEHPNTSFPQYLQPADIIGFGYFPVIDNAPSFDPATENLVELAIPVLTNGQWHKDYSVVALTTEELAAIEAAKQAAIAAQAAADAKKKSENELTLWAAADAYEKNYISGVAIGLLTMGVMTSKPKSIAVAAWSASIWTEYYTRKATVTKDFVPSLDFSSFGAIPFSVPELRAELGM